KDISPDDPVTRFQNFFGGSAHIANPKYAIGDVEVEFTLVWRTFEVLMHIPKAWDNKFAGRIEGDSRRGLLFGWTNGLNPAVFNRERHVVQDFAVADIDDAGMSDCGGL